jgi:hypothetical protein
LLVVLHCVVPGVQTGAPVHEHVPQVQLARQVCAPYVLHACVAFGAQAH